MTKEAEAASCALVGTVPDPIYTSTDVAAFRIDIGNTKEPGIASWRMEFQCGWLGRYKQANTTIINSKTISATIKNNEYQLPGQGCEFFEGPQAIQVKAITDKGNSVDWCNLVSYKVASPDGLCKLSIDPSTNLTPASVIAKPIKVSGEKLVKGGRYQLFIDNNLIDLGINPYLETHTFKDIEIPQKFLSPTKHVLHIARFNPGMGPPLCPLEFEIGTTAAPGSVSTAPPTGTGTGIKAIIPAFGGGETCGTTADPGIKTAVGCIHTNLKEFIRDVLRFAIGISGGLAFLMMLVGTFQMLTSAGNPDSLNAGRDRLTNAIVGLLFVIFSILLLQIIGVDILGLPGFSR